MSLQSNPSQARSLLRRRSMGLVRLGELGERDGNRGKGRPLPPSPDQEPVFATATGARGPSPATNRSCRNQRGSPSGPHGGSDNPAAGRFGPYAGRGRSRRDSPSFQPNHTRPARLARFAESTFASRLRRPANGKCSRCRRIECGSERLFLYARVFFIH